MISFQINRLIHSVIRENKLILLLNAIIDENIDVFEDFSKQLKTFLKIDHDILFDKNKEKYIIYLDNIKQNLNKMYSLKDKDITKTSLMFYKLYQLPKKRNNLFLVYLIYFYIKNKNILWCSEIFKIIYIYILFW